MGRHNLISLKQVLSVKGGVIPVTGCGARFMLKLLRGENLN